MIILNSLKRNFFLLFGILGAGFNCPSIAHAEISVSNVACPNIAVKSIDRSIPFFTTFLDFKLVDQKDTSDTSRSAPGMPNKTRARSAHMTLGEECLDLTEYSFPKSSPFPADSHGNDKWFQHIAIVVSDMDKAYARLRDAHVQFVSNVPQTLPDWNKNAAGISAFYFRDPDGHYLELIHFPPGKGLSKWQNHSENLFLGIDHTAITVSNTKSSLEFYRDKLHLRVVGGSENYGIEQEHLSGVFNAHVLITTLRTDSGIGIEFLEYLSPSGGRETPSSSKISDIPIWQTVMESKVSIDSSKSNSERSDSSKAVWMKDPDGHVVKLIQVK